MKWPDLSGLVPFPVAAKALGITYSTLYDASQAGMFPEAVKVSDHWYVPANMDWRHRFVKGKPKKRVTVRYCKRCQEPFQVVSIRKHYCSYRCEHYWVLELYSKLGTLELVAQELGITRERARQILKKVDPDYKSKKSKQEEVICPVCKINPLPKSNRGRRVTCSKECHDRFYRERTEKRCSRCKEVKPIESFTITAKATRTRAPRCKECCAAIQKERARKRKLGIIPHIVEGEGKVCPGCHKFKGWGAFHAGNANRDGHQIHCKDCQANRDQKRNKRAVRGPNQPKKSLVELFEERKLKEKEWADRWNLD